VAQGSLASSRALVVVLVTLATFTDLLAYSIAVPVLPDLTARLGATPTVIGLLFGAFGVTLLVVSVPAGALSDRVGRRLPMVAGMIVLAGSTLLFAYGTTLPVLFAARLLQGAADGIAWGVGLALIADVFGPAERGRVMGLVMSGSNVGFMLGPSIGGWLYERGGAAVPFLLVTALSVIVGLGFILIRMGPPADAREPVPFRTLIRVPAVLSCIVVVVIVSSTMSMFEPVLSLFLSLTIGLSPRQVGNVFGAAAVGSALLHPVYGRLADRVGSRRLMVAGLLSASLVMPILAGAETYTGALALFVVQAAALSMVVAPSLAYMAEASGSAGAPSFGVAYGLYNFAWGGGLLVGPAVGGALFERIGFMPLLRWWPAILVCGAIWLLWTARHRSGLVASL
jgi:MFS transporter, DHA1 family, solute carrier family 18 (vesicular amine transporter), member 1/2